MRLRLLLILPFLSICSMGQNAKNTTKGACSPIMNGNKGVVSLNCSNLDPAVAQKLIELADAFSELSRNTQNQRSHDKLIESINLQTSEVLERIKSVQSELAGRKLDNFDPNEFIPFKAMPLLIAFLQGDSETRELAQDMAEKLTGAGLAVRPPMGLPQSAFEKPVVLSNDPPIDPKDIFLRGYVIIQSINATKAAETLQGVLRRNGIPVRHVMYENSVQEPSLSIRVCSRR